MSKFFISCEEANHTCDKSQYKEASVLEKIKLSLHLLYCKVCRNYSKNNTKLTKFIKQNETALTSESKEKIKLALEEELAKFKD